MTDMDIIPNGYRNRTASILDGDGVLFSQRNRETRKNVCSRYESGVLDIENRDLEEHLDLFSLFARRR